ncbi:MAG: hypothetical protein NVS9B12_12720 [Vulcanimicrobiaceae bacterium]
MQIIRSVVIVFWLAAVMTPDQAAGQTSAPVFASRVDAAVADAMKHYSIPGVSVAIIDRGRVAYVKGYGVVRSGESTPVTPQTLFHLGSVTKMFTAAALVKMSLQGRLDLQAPIGAAASGLPECAQNLTLEQLLSQSSGLKDFPGADGAHEESALNTFVASWPPAYCLFEPGVSFSYSNLGFALAGDVLQQRYGKPYADALSDLVLRPLGMNASTMRPRDTTGKPMAAGHHLTAGKIAVVAAADDTRLWPAGYLFSNAADLSRFIVAMLKNGRIARNGVFPAALPAILETPRVPIRALFDDGHYGFGLIERRDGADEIFEHPGDLPGYEAFLRFIPARKFGVVVLINADDTPIPRLVDAIDSIVTGRRVGATAATATGIPVSKRDGASLVGHYSNRWDIDITQAGDRTWLAQNGTKEVIYTLGNDRYTIGKAGPLFRIVRDAQGAGRLLQLFLWTFAKSAS